MLQPNTLTHTHLCIKWITCMQNLLLKVTLQNHQPCAQGNIHIYALQPLFYTSQLTHLLIKIASTSSQFCRNISMCVHFSSQTSQLSDLSSLPHSLSLTYTLTHTPIQSSFYHSLSLSQNETCFDSQLILPTP